MFINNQEQCFRQHEKEVYIANKVINKLLFENCTQAEYRNILKIVEQRLLDKSLYNSMEYE